MAHTPGDVAALGRMMLMMFAKLFIGGLCGRPAALVGFAAWWLGGLVAAAITAWIVLAAVAALFVPLLAMAFNRFDVASETPA